MSDVSQKPGNRGITLTELLVSVFLLGLLAYVMPLAIKLLNAIKYQQQMAEANQQIEVFIGLLSQDINNSPEFDGAPTATKLKLFALNARDYSLNADGPGYPKTLSPDLFGQIQYELVQKDKSYCIRRTATYSGPAPSPCASPCTGPVRTESRDFLQGIVLPQSIAGHPLFGMGGDNDTIVFDLSFYYPFQRKTDKPKRFIKNVLKWSNYVD